MDETTETFSADYKSFKNKSYQKLRHSFQQYKRVWTKTKLQKLLDIVILKANEDKDLTKTDFENLKELALDIECELEFIRPKLRITSRKVETEDKIFEEVLNITDEHKSSTNLLEEMTLELIVKTLKLNDGNRTKTATNLGISIRTLRNWNRKFNIQIERAYKWKN